MNSRPVAVRHESVRYTADRSCPEPMFERSLRRQAGLAQFDVAAGTVNMTKREMQMWLDLLLSVSKCSAQGRMMSHETGERVRQPRHVQRALG